MIKGVRSTPNIASLSPNQASANDALLLVNQALATMNENPTGPASGVHVTVLLDEAVQALAVKADGVYVDGTFGRGGHSRKILEKLGEQGRLIGFDKDLQAIESSKAIQDKRFVMVHSHFAGMQAHLAEMGVHQWTAFCWI